MSIRQRLRRRQRDLVWFLGDHVPGYTRFFYRWRVTRAHVADGTLGRDAFGVVRWNTDKKHRCPSCHAVTVDDQRPSWRETYDCCRCGTRFARWPVLSPLLPDRGVVCTEHRTTNNERRTAQMES